MDRLESTTYYIILIVSSISIGHQSYYASNQNIDMKLNCDTYADTWHKIYVKENFLSTI